MRVSIILVTYNAEATIREAILSLQQQSYRDCEIIVVDNDSRDNTLPIVRELLPEGGKNGKVVCSKANAGFAGGNSSGLKYAAGEYIALLNADAFAGPQWLQRLVEAMDSQEGAGICASRIISFGSSAIDSAGDGFSRSLQGFKRGEGELPEMYGERGYVFGACACAALYRRKMVEEIGFFDDDFFLIHEDTDLNLRAQLAGWKVLYVPEAVVYHKVRSSIGNMSDIAIYYTIRNRDLVRVKNVPAGIFLRCFPQFVMSIIAEFIYFVLKHKKLRLYIHAKRDALAMLPEMMRKRSAIMKRRRVSNGYLFSTMTPLRGNGFARSKLKKMLHG